MKTPLLHIVKHDWTTTPQFDTEVQQKKFTKQFAWVISTTTSSRYRLHKEFSAGHISNLYLPDAEIQPITRLILQSIFAAVQPSLCEAVIDQ